MQTGWVLSWPFVRSLQLDEWKEDEISLMVHGGNKKCKDYFRSFGLDALPIAAKYHTRAAHQYAQQLCQEAGVKFSKPQLSHKIMSEAQSEDVLDKKKKTVTISKNIVSDDTEQIERSKQFPRSISSPLNQNNHISSEEPIPEPKEQKPDKTQTKSPNKPKLTKSTRPIKRSTKNTRKAAIIVNDFDFDDLQESESESDSDHKETINNNRNNFNNNYNIPSSDEVLTAPKRPPCKYESCSNVPSNDYVSSVSGGYESNSKNNQNQTSQQSAIESVGLVVKEVAKDVTVAVQRTAEYVAPMASAAWEKTKDVTTTIYNYIKNPQ